MNGKTRLESFRADARRLLKQLRSGDERAAPAARRFRQLDTLSGYSVEALAAGTVPVQHKHALSVVAEEAGFASWALLKSMCEQDAAAPVTTPPMYEPSMVTLLNAWFPTHQEAAEARNRHGGYLLPYRQQYFVCEGEGVRLLGLDPQDPDWEQIDYDFARPADPGAWARLARARWQHLKETRPKEELFR